MVKKTYVPEHNKMIIDFDVYKVEIYKSKNKDEYDSEIKYIDKISEDTKIIPTVFNIDWDPEEDGGRLQIKFRDRWGSEMIFIHYFPSDMKGMFDFIGNGYKIFKPE